MAAGKETSLAAANFQPLFFSSSVMLRDNFIINNLDTLKDSNGRPVRRPACTECQHRRCKCEREKVTDKYRSTQVTGIVLHSNILSIARTHLERSEGVWESMEFCTLF
ncbi:hypothetical protein DFH11DRAFT_1547538 [Phellopilus nigrolimitatus]|nr:hypothetical protein DFH11DRAFT_1547538 [Phellopilus nigrolimitatus]